MILCDKCGMGYDESYFPIHVAWHVLHESEFEPIDHGGHITCLCDAEFDLIECSDDEVIAHLNQCPQYQQAYCMWLLSQGAEI